MAALVPQREPQLPCLDAVRWNPVDSAAISQLLVELAWLAAYPADCGHDALRPRAIPAGDEVLCPLNAVSPVESLT